MGEERLCRVEPELPTVCGGEVYLVKAAACDPKELAETSAGVRKASLDPIVPVARLLQAPVELALGSVLFVQKTRSAGGGLGAPLSCVGRPSVGANQSTSIAASS